MSRLVKVDLCTGRMEAVLATPLLTLHDPDGNFPMKLRLSSFNRAVADRAAELLEEAGQ